MPMTTNIVALNGCFDRLHAGHLFLLGNAYALAQGGKVIVGINCDEYVQNVKSSKAQNEETRTAALIDSKIVDQVKVFKGATPIDFIKETKPTIYLIGEEYRGKAPEEKYLKDNNIKIYYIPRVGSWSSSQQRKIK